MAPKQPNTGLFVGLNKGHVTTKKELVPRPSDRKGDTIMGEPTQQGPNRSIPTLEEGNTMADYWDHGSNNDLDDVANLEDDSQVIDMDPKRLPGVSLPDNVVHLLLSVSNSSVLDKGLECLIGMAKSADGRSELSSKYVVPAVVQFCKSLSYPSERLLILLSLKLLRNLCAGEIVNQNSFLEEDGVGVTLGVVSNARVGSASDCEIIRMGLQLLGNVTLAGLEHKLAVWNKFFTHEFHEIAKIRSSDICDPLCMVLYTVCNGTDGLGELRSDKGILILIEILKTATIDGFKEEWLKKLFSRICLESSQFQQIFTKLYPISVGNKVNSFAAEQAFLLSVLSETLSENMKDFIVNCDFALAVLQILGTAHQIVDFSIRGTSSLPTGNAGVDVLGYSLIILRDICACDGLIGHEENAVDVVDILLSNGLIGLLIDLLHDLEPPALIKKAMSQSNPCEGKTSQPAKCCAYKGFRRDIISVIGNCSYKRKRVQDEIRKKKGIVLLLQQCGADEDNPFLREWGIWTMRNILENNTENQKIVSDLELQGSADVPEIAKNGLRVEVDPTTRRAKLVNTSSRVERT